MSTLKVSIERIVDIKPHPNADRLEIATVLGWQCVVQKGLWEVGDFGVYFPIDSVLPQDIEDLIFGPDSKVKLHNHRIRTIKLRGVVSQGLFVKEDTVRVGGNYPLGYDLTARLGVTKYEPPAPPTRMQGNGVKKQDENPYFPKYTDIENIKNFPGFFKEGEKVIITEKIHGTNFRCGWVKKRRRWYHKLFRWDPGYEFVVGSRNVQFASKSDKCYYDSNVYVEIATRYDLKKALRPGEVIFGEIYGPGIQKGYEYGASKPEFVAFELQLFGEYTKQDFALDFFMERNIPCVPSLYQGPYTGASLHLYTTGTSRLDSTTVREGCVVQSLESRKLLKSINPEYLLKDTTEWH